MSESETETTTEAVVETPRRKRSTSTSTSAETRTLAERMAAAMAHIHPPPKAGKMVMQGKPIPYVTVDDLMEVLRPSLAAEGIAFSIDVQDVRKGLSDPVAVMLRVRLAAAEEALVANAYGEGRTYAIAQTYAVKYWLLRTFLVGSGEDDEIANVEPEPDPRPASNRRQAPAQQAPQQERRVAQNGTTREAPPTAYREDNGRAALRRRAWDVLVNYYAEGAPADQAKAVVRTGLLALAEDHPDMVPVVNDDPSLQTASNDQLQRLIGYVQSLRPGEDVPF